MSLERRLMKIQKSLKPQCSVKLAYDRRMSTWDATIETEGGRYPYWVSYSGEKPGEAVSALEEYLRGEREDHSADKRSPEVFLDKAEVTA
jgi:hypothetical protein